MYDFFEAMPKKSLTIFLVTNNYKPYEGGVARSVDTLCGALRARGHVVYIITLDFLGNGSEFEEHIIRVPCVMRWFYKKNYMALPLLCSSYLTKVAETLKPDIIHVHHPFLLGVAGLRAARSLRIPIVFTYHTNYEHYLHYIPIFPQYFTRSVVNTVVRKFCYTVDGIIVPGKIIHEHLIDRSVTTMMKVIPSAIDPIFFVYEKEKKRRERIHLLSVSRFAKEKNIEFLLRVMKHLGLQRYTLTLVGYGTHEEYLRWYAYESLGLSKNFVKFIIKPSRQELATLYREADLFIFASITETQGLVLAEAMASGLPVIAVDAPGPKDIVRNDSNGFLVQSEQEMVARIISLEENNKLYGKLRENALKSAEGYAPEIVVDRIKSFYAHLIEQNRLVNEG